MLPGILQAGFGQVDAQTASTDGGRDFGVQENDDIARQHVIEYSQMSINCKFEAMFFGVVSDFNVFCSHVSYCIGANRTDGKYFAVYR